MDFLAELKHRLRTALTGMADVVDPYVEMLKPSQDARFGDFQANCAMPLANLRKQSPRALAEQIVAKLDVADLCESVDIAGPGFINFRIATPRLAAETAALCHDPRLGVPPVTQPQTFIVDFSAPNVAKPMHVGHLRSTVLGNALYRILKFMGHRVIGDNHVGDWGTQFGMILFGFKHFRDPAAFAANPVQELARLYRLVNQLIEYHDLPHKIAEGERNLAAKRAQLAALTAEEQPQQGKRLNKEIDDLEKSLAGSRAKREKLEADPQKAMLAQQHPKIEELARLETAKLHAGDPENTQYWQQFMPACMRAIQGLYDRLGVTFDLTLGESYYNPRLPGVVAELQHRNLARESQGAICVFREGKAAPFIVRKQDGAYTYATTDLATIEYRVRELKADVVLYVVDARQGEHFEDLFDTAKRLGYTQQFVHVRFGTILGKDNRPFKTRDGDTVGLESLLDEAVAEARKIVDDNSPDLAEQQRADVAEIVGLGGVIYADLLHNRDSDYQYDKEKMLAKTGNTATYLQYAYARVHGIFRKGQLTPETVAGYNAPIQLTTPAERKLALQLHAFGQALSAVLWEYRPNLLVSYLYDTANTFSEFFENCPVLKADVPQPLRESRLQLCLATANVLRTGIELLGIRVAEQI